LLSRIVYAVGCGDAAQYVILLLDYDLARRVSQVVPLSAKCLPLRFRLGLAHLIAQCSLGIAKSHERIVPLNPDGVGNLFLDAIFKFPHALRALALHSLAKRLHVSFAQEHWVLAVAAVFTDTIKGLRVLNCSTTRPCRRSDQLPLFLE
jgi:hypothetical protein